MTTNRLAQYTNQVQDGYGMEEFQPIPKGTEVVCFVETIAWETMMNTRVTPPQQDEFVKVKYRVKGGEFDNRVLFQKLYLLGKVDQDAEKNQRSEEHAWLMLAALDHICSGGQLAKLPHDPEDVDLAKLCNKKILVTVDINRYKDRFNETVAQNTVRLIAPVAPAARPGAANAEASAERQPRQRRARA